MKHLAWLFLGIVLTATSCKKANELTQFNINYKHNIVIPSSTVIDLPFNVMSPDVETNSDTEFQSNSTRKDKIETIKLTKLNLNLKSPSGSSFSFLEAVEVYLQADGLNDVKIAWKENIPNTVGSSLNLEVSNEDIKAFITKDKFNLRLRTITDEVITSDHEIEASTTLFVDAKLL